MDVLIGVILTRTQLKNLLSVMMTHSCVFLTCRYTSSSLASAMNATDHIKVVFRKFPYSLMSRVTASPNSIVTVIVSSDAYLHAVSTDE